MAGKRQGLSRELRRLRDKCGRKRRDKTHYATTTKLFEYWINFFVMEHWRFSKFDEEAQDIRVSEGDKAGIDTTKSDSFDFIFPRLHFITITELERRDTCRIPSLLLMRIGFVWFSGF